MGKTNLIIAKTICSMVPPAAVGRLRNVLYPREMSIRDNFKITGRTITGSKFEGNTLDPAAYFLLTSGYNDWRNVAIAKCILKPGDEIVEVGANVGTETFSFSDLVGNNGTVYAFEPLPANYEVVKNNILLNNITNIKLETIAISDKEGEFSFEVPKAINSGMGKILVAGANARESETIKIKALPLDHYINDFKRPKLLALDTEGHEPYVLKGATEVINKFRPYIIVEAAEKRLKSSASSIAELYKILKDMNYEVYDIGRFGLVHIAQNPEKFSPSNWLCIPNELNKMHKQISSYLLRTFLTPVIFGLNPLSK